MPRVKKIFISYVRENRTIAKRIARALKDRGVVVWFDKQLQPGDFWKDAIRAAIRDSDFAIVCFSNEYAHRRSTYMNEELTFVVEELRQRPFGVPWLIPALISGDLPEISLGAGRTLTDIQYVDVSEKNREAGIDAIVLRVAGGPELDRDLIKQYLFESPPDGAYIQPKFDSLSDDDELKAYLAHLRTRVQRQFETTIRAQWPSLRKWELDFLGALLRGTFYRPHEVDRFYPSLEAALKAYYKEADAKNIRFFRYIGRDCFDQDNDWEFQLYDVARDPLRRVLLEQAG